MNNENFINIVKRFIPDSEVPFFHKDNGRIIFDINIPSSVCNLFLKQHLISTIGLIPTNTVNSVVLNYIYEVETRNLVLFSINLIYINADSYKIHEQIARISKYHDYMYNQSSKVNPSDILKNIMNEMMSEYINENELFNEVSR